MVQSHFWEANWSAASQEIPRISRNPKVHYRTHKRPPPVSILGQPNPVHIPTSHHLEIHLHIIHPTKPRSPQWSSSLRFPQQDPIYPLSSPIRATCLAHLILLDFITRTILGEEYKSFSSSLYSLLHSPVNSSLLSPNSAIYFPLMSVHFPLIQITTENYHILAYIFVMCQSCNFLQKHFYSPLYSNIPNFNPEVTKKNQ